MRKNVLLVRRRKRKNLKHQLRSNNKRSAHTPREAHDIAQILMNLRQAENWFYGEALDETGKLPSGKKNTERR